MIKVALVIFEFENRQFFLESFANFPQFDCLVETSDLESFARFKKKFKSLDLIFLADREDGTASLEELPRLRRLCPNAEIIPCSDAVSVDDFFKALNLGAAGYFTKGSEAARLPDLLHCYLLGGALLSPELGRWLIQRFQPVANTRRNESLEHLSPKTKEVLRLLSEGYAYEKIGKKMGMKLDSVRYYVKRIYYALGVKNKVEAINRYLEK